MPWWAAEYNRDNTEQKSKLYGINDSVVFITNEERDFKVPVHPFKEGEDDRASLSFNPSVALERNLRTAFASTLIQLNIFIGIVDGHPE